MTADPTSRSYYVRVKGSAEDAIKAPGFKRVSLFRPSLLVTTNIRYGLQDRIVQTLFPALAWLLPRSWHQIKIEDLARAMRINAERPAADGVEALTYAHFMALGEDRA